MTLEEMRAYIARDAFATECCGIRIDSMDETEAVLSMPVEKRHLNANGVVQGGVIYTLCDTAFAVAANAGKARLVNRSAEITYLKPGRGAILYARAKCVAQGGSMGLFQIEAYDENQTLIAYMAANGFITEKK